MIKNQYQLSVTNTGREEPTAIADCDEGYPADVLYVSHTPYVQNGKVYCSACGGDCAISTLTVDEEGNLHGKRDNPQREGKEYEIALRSPAIAVPADPLTLLIAESFVEEARKDIKGISNKPRAIPKHQSTFDIVKTRIKNRKLNKLAKKARRK